MLMANYLGALIRSIVCLDFEIARGFSVFDAGVARRLFRCLAEFELFQLWQHVWRQIMLVRTVLVGLLHVGQAFDKVFLEILVPH